MKSGKPTTAAMAAALMGSKKSGLDRDKRLPPIYEALDAGNYKGALKLVNQNIEKFGNEHILMV